MVAVTVRSVLKASATVAGACSIGRPSCPVARSSAGKTTSYVSRPSEPILRSSPPPSSRASPSACSGKDSGSDRNSSPGSTPEDARSRPGPRPCGGCDGADFHADAAGKVEPVRLDREVEGEHAVLHLELDDAD